MGGRPEAQEGELVPVRLRAQLIEDVVVALLLGLEDDARLLQQVGLHAGAHDVVLAVEVDLDVLAEAAAVVVARCFGVAEGLHDGVGGEHLLLHLGHLWTNKWIRIEYLLYRGRHLQPKKRQGLGPALGVRFSENLDFEYLGFG